MMAINPVIPQSGVSFEKQAPPQPKPTLNRAEILRRLEQPDTFQKVMMEDPMEGESEHIQELRMALRQEPLSREEIFGDAQEHIPENPKLRANFYDQFARQFDRIKSRTSNPTSSQSVRFNNFIGPSTQSHASTDSLDYDPPVFYPDGPDSSGASTPNSERQPSLIARIIQQVFSVLLAWVRNPD
jgi:hypothetical protein